jgi:hypothetical protein
MSQNYSDMPETVRDGQDSGTYESDWAQGENPTSGIAEPTRTVGQPHSTNSGSLAMGGNVSRASTYDQAGDGISDGPLLRNSKSLQQRWESIQVGFVDNPRESVAEAEQLVSSAIGEISTGFREQRETLEASWSRGQDPSTDELRTAFQGYRDFFGRLLQV